MLASDGITHEFPAYELQIQSVTVYRDRAEVRRVVEVDLKSGMNKVLIQDIPTIADDDSVLVSGLGDAIIHEVQTQLKPTNRDDVTSPRFASLRAEKETQVKQKQKLEDTKDVAMKRGTLLREIIAPATKTMLKDADGGGGDTEATFEKLTKMLDHHDQHFTAILEKAREIDDQIRKHDERIRQLDEEMNQAKCDGSHSKTICILLEAKSDGLMKLFVSYQARNARWHPIYDIRVDSATKSLKLTYNGKIHQSTGEDWVNAPLILSNAEPTCGGTIPLLGTQRAEFVNNIQVRQPQPAPFGSVPERMAKRTNGMFAAAAPMMDMALAKVALGDGMISTTFTIERNTTIPSDDTDHKVTILALQSEPKLFYITVPSKSTNAFLTASVLNESGSPLLAGLASVYLDSSFIATSSIKNVQSGEFFLCSLGVDPAIKIEYKPVHKYTEQAGILNKIATTVHEQKILIKNTKSTDIVIAIREHVPESTDEKIKIKLFAPELTKDLNTTAGNGNELAPELGVRMNDDHNLQWTVEVKAHGDKELLIKWSIEHPLGQPVTLNEYFSRTNLH